MKDLLKILMCLLSLLVISLIITIVIYFVLLYFNLSDLDLKDCATFAISVTTIAFTYGEYLSKKDADKTEMLLSYNKRFIEDETIQKVVTYLQYFDENRDKPNFDPTSVEEPKKADFILFARFFEELQSLVQSHNIDKEYVCRLYAYYAVEAYINHKEKIGEVETDNSWFLFRSFCLDMMKIEESLNIKHE